MASIASLVAFFILLLTVFSYSAPIGEEYGNSTSEEEYTTNQNIVDWQKADNMGSLVVDESTSVPSTEEEESSEEEDVSDEDVTPSPRNYEDSSYSSATNRTDEEYTLPSSGEVNEKRIYEYSTYAPTSENSEGSSETYSLPSSTEVNGKSISEYSTYAPTSESSEESNENDSSTQMNEEPNPMGRQNAAMTNGERTVEDFLGTTLESSTEFNQRALRPSGSGEEMELSTTMYPQNQTDMTNDTEPLSSVHSFGKYTGLLVDQQSTTTEYQTTDRPDEESTKDSVVNSEQLIKTISIFPGKITETKIYSNTPSKSSVVIQPVEQEQLRQVPNQPVTETKKWDN